MYNLIYIFIMCVNFFKKIIVFEGNKLCPIKLYVIYYLSYIIDIQNYLLPVLQYRYCNNYITNNAYKTSFKKLS